MENKTKLSPPWYTFMRKLDALFGGDPDIKNLTADGGDETSDNPRIRLLVDNDNKAHALTKLLPPCVYFGDVRLDIEVVPSNEIIPDYAKLFRTAFNGNPVVKDILQVDTPSFKRTYIIFRKDVAQFYNDNLGDPHGYTSMLFEDIARDVFADNGISFCTDIESKK